MEEFKKDIWFFSILDDESLDLKTDELMNVVRHVFSA
jgi:hypothetical protein